LILTEGIGQLRPVAGDAFVLQERDADCGKAHERGCKQGFARKSAPEKERYTGQEEDRFVGAGNKVQGQAHAQKNAVAKLGVVSQSRQRAENQTTCRG